VRLTRKQLKMLVETLILNEGQVEDLLAANPQLQPAVDAGITNLNQLKWLLRMEKFEPIADIAGLIPAFEKNKQRLVIKDLNLYKNTNDLRAALEAAGESKGQQRRQLKESESDIVYQDEQWLVVMPHTRESSIQWGKGTTWCTAATQSANLFYNYVGRKLRDIILFYILKKRADSTVDPNAKLSVGFIGGKPTLDGKKGGVSVNASNEGLTQESLKEILGSEFDPIMSAMESHSSKLKGQHPAKVAMQKLAMSKDPNVLDKYTQGMDKNERKDFINILFEYELSPEVLTQLGRDKDKFVRSNAVGNPNTTPEVLTLLARDEKAGVRASVAQAFNTPPEALASLARDKDKVVRAYAVGNYKTPLSPELLTLLARDEYAGVRAAVAFNPDTLPEALALLARDKDKVVRANAAGNPNTPLSPELLALLARDEYARVRASVAQAFNTPPEALASLARDKDKVVRAYAAGNPNTPLSPELLTLLARDEYTGVRAAVAFNPNTPPEILASLAKDKNENVRNYVIFNPNTHPEVLDSLVNDKVNWIRMSVAQKSNTPPEALASLASDVDKAVRAYVARNPNTPPEILAILARDEYTGVRAAVAFNPTYQKYLESQTQLTERWLRLAGLLN